jgi:hypothetical protein
MRAAVSAAVYGWIVRSGVLDRLPTIPVLGRTGSIAVLAYLAARQGIAPQYTRQIAGIAATIAGYQLGSTGAVSGDDTADTAEGTGYAAEGDDIDD